MVASWLHFPCALWLVVNAEGSNINSVLAEELSSCKSDLAYFEAQSDKLFQHCADVKKRLPESESGVYNVNIMNIGGRKTAVYCDMETLGGGWLVIQRRQDGSEDFYRPWVDYVNGFGSPDAEIWLGNDKLHTLTAEEDMELNIELGDFEGNKRHAKYSVFKVGPEADGYRLTVSGYSGDATDSLGAHSGMKFSTKDVDNDIHAPYNCAVMDTGAWWYDACHISNLNGIYFRFNPAPHSQGIVWQFWKDPEYSLKYVEMKIKPKLVI